MCGCKLVACTVAAVAYHMLLLWLQQSCTSSSNHDDTRPRDESTTMMQQLIWFQNPSQCAHFLWQAPAMQQMSLLQVIHLAIQHISLSTVCNPQTLYACACLFPEIVIKASLALTALRNLTTAFIIRSVWGLIY